MFGFFVCLVFVLGIVVYLFVGDLVDYEVLVVWVCEVLVGYCCGWGYCEVFGKVYVGVCWCVE